MDYPQQQSDINRELMRRIAYLERQQSQLFSKYQAQLTHPRIVKLARTIEEFDENEESTYPAQDTTIKKHFPIVFISGGHANADSSASASFTAHDETEQAFVFSTTHNWIPPDTILEVWRDVGTEANYPGFWWTVFRDPIRVGITKVAIAQLANGNVDEYEPDWTDESSVIQTWLCRNWCGYDLEANTQVFFSQRKGVAYILNAACSAAGSGVGSG